MGSRGTVDVLYEDNHLLVVNKPTGIATMGAPRSRTSLVVEAKEYLREKYRKPGRVYLGVVSRLDASVSGVVVFARTSKAAGRLAAQFRARSPEKRYVALVDGAPSPASALLCDFIERVGHGVRVTGTSDVGQEARLRYRTLLGLPDATTALEVLLETGRKHQIRVQLAKVGHPILGDRRYGSSRRFGDAIALHAWSLQLEHPISAAALRFVAPPPRSWPSADALARLLVASE
jgi:23S rRNA pseudouridine1911/1915/1917 synthase